MATINNVPLLELIYNLKKIIKEAEIKYAKINNICRICKGEIFDEDKVLTEKGLVLNYGTEFAHRTCLKAEDELYGITFEEVQRRHPEIGTSADLPDADWD